MFQREKDRLKLNFARSSCNLKRRVSKKVVSQVWFWSPNSDFTTSLASPSEWFTFKGFLSSLSLSSSSSSSPSLSSPTSLPSGVILSKVDKDLWAELKPRLVAKNGVTTFREKNSSRFAILWARCILAKKGLEHFLAGHEFWHNFFCQESPFSRNWLNIQGLFNCYFMATHKQC